MFEGETKLEKKNLEDFKLNAEQKFSASQTIRYYSHYPSFTQYCQGIVNRTLQSEFCKGEIKQEPRLQNRAILRKFQSNDNFVSKIINNS